MFVLIGSMTVPAIAMDGAESADPSPDGPHIGAIYPNPLADGDAGEYVLLDIPRATNLSGWTLSDGETNVSLPNSTVSGRVAVTDEPNVTRNVTDASLLVTAESVNLANAGDEVKLIHRGRVVDATTYEDAPDAERWNRTPDGWTWEHLGATHFIAREYAASSARTFVLPDDPDVAITALDAAHDRILLAGYTFSSTRVAAALKRAAERGVEVQVLVDDAPVGGVSVRQAKVLDSLSRAGIPVEVIGGDWARYDYHHAKYAVIDNRALVMTENWKPSGVGGHENRGWGTIVNGSVADALATVFRADADWRDTVSWGEFRANRSFTTKDVANETYPSNFAPKTVKIEGVQLLVAPDNAETALVNRLDNATESIDVIQPTIGSRHQPFLRATIRAARRGVSVRILLSNAWYSEDENEALVDWINHKAKAEDLPLEAKIVEPGSHFEDIHAKGVVIDNDTAVVGSMNWNNNSARDNREVALVLDGDAVGRYYERVFVADWRGDADDSGSGLSLDSPLPVGIIAAVVGVVALGIVVARRIEFE